MFVQNFLIRVCCSVCEFRNVLYNPKSPFWRHLSCSTNRLPRPPLLILYIFPNSSPVVALSSGLLGVAEIKLTEWYIRTCSIQHGSKVSAVSARTDLDCVYCGTAYPPSEHQDPVHRGTPMFSGLMWWPSELHFQFILLSDCDTIYSSTTMYQFGNFLDTI